MANSSVVIELYPDENGKVRVSRVVKWYRDAEGNLQYAFNTTNRVMALKNEPKQVQKFFSALGVPSVFYHRDTGRYSKYL